MLADSPSTAGAVESASPGRLISLHPNEHSIASSGLRPGPETGYAATWGARLRAKRPNPKFGGKLGAARALPSPDAVEPAPSQPLFRVR